MKPLVIYHTNCADGFGAAFAAYIVLGEEAEYLALQHGEINHVAHADLGDDRIKSLLICGVEICDREVYILDFSFPKPVMDLVFRAAERIVWRDHHKTAFEMWCGTYKHGMDYDQIGDSNEGCGIDIYLNDNKSGAMLAWEHFHPSEEIPMFIRHIDDYDRWQFKLADTKAFNKALWSYAPWSFEQWQREWDNTWSHADSMSYFINEGDAILRAHDQNVQAVVKGATQKCEIHICEFDEECEKDIDRYIIGQAANCPAHLTSDVGHELANRSGTYGLLWYIDSNNICKCSLRSNGDYDVSAIAKAFGGGGHRNAAGFQTDINTLLSWLK